MKLKIAFQISCVVLLIQVSPLCSLAQWWEELPPAFYPTFPASSASGSVYDYLYCARESSIIDCAPGVYSTLSAATVETLVQGGVLKTDRTYLNYLQRAKYYENCSPVTITYSTTTNAATKQLATGGGYSFTPDEATYNDLAGFLDNCSEPD